MQFVVLVMLAYESVSLLVYGVFDEAFTAGHRSVFKIKPVIDSTELDKSSSCLFCPTSFGLLGVSLEVEHLSQKLLLDIELRAAVLIKSNFWLL